MKKGKLPAAAYRVHARPDPYSEIMLDLYPGEAVRVYYGKLPVVEAKGTVIMDTPSSNWIAVEVQPDAGDPWFSPKINYHDTWEERQGWIRQDSIETTGPQTDFDGKPKPAKSSAWWLWLALAAAAAKTLA